MSYGNLVIFANIDWAQAAGPDILLIQESKARPEQIPVLDFELMGYRNFWHSAIICVYHPSGSSGEERQAFKMQWLEDFYNYVHELKKERPIWHNHCM